MFTPERFTLYNADHSLKLTVEPLPREEALALFPGTFIVADAMLAKTLGVSAVSADEMNARAAEFAAMPEESILRLWVSSAPTSDGRTVFVSPLDSLPDVGDAPDWGLKSAGYLLGDIEALSSWLQTTYEVESAEDIRRALSKFLSEDLAKMDRAVVLIETETENILMYWPILWDNPILARRASTSAYPEVCYTDSDFDFSLKRDISDA